MFILSNIVKKTRPLMSSTARLIEFSDTRYFSRSMVSPETQTPALLSIYVTRVLVPDILKNKPRMSGRTFVA
jgi:hypothetical protein